MSDRETIQPNEVYEIAAKELPAEDIDHHYSDLYLKITPASKGIVDRLPRNRFGGEPALLSKFRSQIDGCMWYDLPFCYAPYWKKEEQFQ